MTATAPERRIDPQAWDGAIADISGRQLIVGGPGTGKTEFLVRRVAHLLAEAAIAPGEVVVLSFGRRSVADLQTRLRSVIPDSIGAIEIATYHSFAARLLEVVFADSREPVPQLLTGPEQTALIRHLLASEDPTAWSPAFRPLLTSATFATEVTDLVLRASEQMLSIDQLESAAADRADWRGVPAFVDRYRRRLRQRSRIDYGELLVEAVASLGAAAGAGAIVRDRTRFVVVDEYQDTTRVQVALLEELAAREGNLTVAADPYQSIYSFRGSDVNNVANFAAGRPEARRIVLTTSFRTPRSILGASERITAGDVPGSAGPVIPVAAEGRVDIEVFDQITEEAEWVATEIQRIHLTDQIPLGKIAVFVRSKRRFLPELSRALERRRIPHDLPDARLIDQPAVRLVLDLVAAAASVPGSLDHEASMRRILLGDLVAVSISRVRDLERRRLKEALGWSELLRSEVRDGEAIAALLDDPSWAAERPAAEGVWTLWTGLPQLQRVVDDPAAADTRAAWSSLMQVLTRWNERSPAATLANFRLLTEDADFEAQPLLSYRSPGADRVTLTTLHQSKGLEFDVVFISDAVEGVFPDLRARDSLLGVRHILPHLPTDNAGYLAFRLQEERRLAYTAMTRAARRVIWTATATGYEEGQGVPSRFLPLVTGTEVDSTRTHRQSSEPVTTAEAGTMLRRIVGDPAASAARRIAALAVLAGGARYGLRPLGAISGTRIRGSDHGVITGPLHLSASQAELYHSCPRRYVLERRLHVSDDSLYLRFGTLFHTVLELAERTAREQGKDRSSIEDALALLEEHLDVADFGGPILAAHWRRRAIAGLERLYAFWPEKSGVAERIEYAIDTRLGGATWVGKIDRIERRGDGVAIVDYKTSKTPMRAEDAKTSLQLGFYTHVVAEDTDVTGGRPIVAAEFWYPLKANLTKVTTVPFAMEHVDDVHEQLIDISAAIAAEDWTPTPGSVCGRCVVAASCPAVATGGEAFA